MMLPILFRDHANPSGAILRLLAPDEVCEEGKEAEAQVLGLRPGSQETNNSGLKG